jgi:ribose 5-phosphate isomerase A
VSKKKQLSADEMKKAAALAALEKIESGMKIGLGTGSTADHFTRALAEKVKKGLQVECVPTSNATAKLAHDLGITIKTLEDLPFLDMTIDGADEIDPKFRLIKGGGGALLFEKIVATSSRFVVTIADESKQVEKLGKFPLPIEVIPFGVRATGWKIERAFEMVGMKIKMVLRQKDGKSFRTDAGNCIVDCHCEEIKEAERLELILNGIPGIVTTGLFIGISGIAFIGKPDGSAVELRRE